MHAKSHSDGSPSSKRYKPDNGTEDDCDELLALPAAAAAPFSHIVNAPAADERDVSGEL